MHVRSLLFLSALSLAWLTGCSSAPPDTHDADVKAIKDTEVAWNKDAKDADKSAGYYAEDATLLIPNQPVITGRDAARQMFKEYAADPNFSLHFQAVKVDVAKSGDLGYTQGTYTMTMTDPATKKPVNDKGKYLTIYRKQADGSWKAVEDTFNSDMPLAKPANAGAKTTHTAGHKRRKA